MEQKAIEGLKILAGDDLLPQGWVWTSENGEDKEHCRQMVEWLNKTETRPGYHTLEGGAYYGYATEMSKRILGMILNSQAENKRLKEFVKWLLRHITDTANVGFIITNTDPQTIKLKADQALQEKP